MKKAIFLDRDGPINNNWDHYYIWRTEDFQLNPGVTETLVRAASERIHADRDHQPGRDQQGRVQCGRGGTLHDHLRSLLEEEGVVLDEIYYCPHHHDGEACLCRKPLAPDDRKGHGPL